MPSKTTTTRPVVPDAPVLPIASKPVASAFKKAIGKHAYVDGMKKSAHSFGALLAKDTSARASIHSLVAHLAHSLAALGTIEKLGKATRTTAFERVTQLEMLCTSLRCAGPDNDGPLIVLAVGLRDGPLRGRITDVLRGGQIGLPASADPALAALFETSDHEVVLRCAFGALWDHDEDAARTAAERVLREGDEPKRIACVLRYLEYAQRDLAPWAPAVLPLTISRSRAIAISACGFLAKQATTFHSFVDWVASRAEPDEQRRAVMALAPQIYWAYVANRDLQKELAAPLRSLRERAKAMKHAVGVKAIDAAAKKAGIVLGA